MLQWDDKNCSPEKLSSTKRSPSFGSMALPKRVFRTLSRPRECANPACIQSSSTKRTCLLQACANNLTAARGEASDNESLADLIITFFCGICLGQNLNPDRAQVTKRIEHFMKLIRGM